MFIYIFYLHLSILLNFYLFNIFHVFNYLGPAVHQSVGDDGVVAVGLPGEGVGVHLTPRGGAREMGLSGQT